MKKIFSIGSIFLLLSFFIVGCGPTSLVVTSRPEPPVYARPAAPGANFVWVEGEWGRGRSGYVYRQGYWAPRGGRHYRYVGGHWQQRRNGWVWVQGHW
jgi:WXXGXW repeat (2 copies)